MFVSDVQPVQLPENVIPSLVRLGGIDCIYGGLSPDQLYLSERVGFKFLKTVINRKARFRVRLLPFDIEKLNDQIVKGAPQILDNLPGNYSDINRNSGGFGNAVVYCSSLRIRLGPESIGISLPEGYDSGFDLQDVLVGPFNLGSDVGDPTHNLAYVR